MIVHYYDGFLVQLTRLQRSLCRPTIYNSCLFALIMLNVGRDMALPFPASIIPAHPELVEGRSLCWPTTGNAVISTNGRDLPTHSQCPGGLSHTFETTNVISR